MHTHTIYNPTHKRVFSYITHKKTGLSLDFNQFAVNNNRAMISTNESNRSDLDLMIKNIPLQFRDADLKGDIPSILKRRKTDKDLYVRTRTEDSTKIKEQCFRIRLANSAESLGSASVLVQEMYSGRGYPSNPVKSHPMSFTLLAYLDDKAVGTITLGLDSMESGLAADALYKNEIDTLRNEGKRLVEFTKLAIDKNPNSQYILGGLLHIAYIYARQIYNYTDVVLEVVPHHERFYKRMLGCRTLGEERANARVNAPVVLLTLDGAHADKMIPLYGGLEENLKDRTLYSYFFTKKDEIGIMNRLLRGDY